MYEKEYKRLSETSGDAFITEYKNFCLTIVEFIDTGKVSLQDGCYAIAGTMFMKEVENNPKLEDIATYAGELELPEAHVSGDIEERWRELKELINQIEIT